MTALGSAHVRAPARRTSRLRRLVLVLAAVGAMALAGPVPAAQAHAFLASSTPADGQVLTTAPDVLRLDFSESVVLSATRIDLVDGAGGHFAPTALDLVSAEERGGTESPVQVVATLPALDHGTYRVSWETLSSDDLHATSGVLVFGVDEAVVAGGLVEPTPPPTEAGLRWLVLLVSPGLSVARSPHGSTTAPAEKVPAWMRCSPGASRSGAPSSARSWPCCCSAIR